MGAIFVPVVTIKKKITQTYKIISITVKRKSSFALEKLFFVNLFLYLFISCQSVNPTVSTYSVHCFSQSPTLKSTAYSTVFYFLLSDCCVFVRPAAQEENTLFLFIDNSFQKVQQCKLPGALFKIQLKVLLFLALKHCFSSLYQSWIIVVPLKFTVN